MTKEESGTDAAEAAIAGAPGRAVVLYPSDREFFARLLCKHTCEAGDGEGCEPAHCQYWEDELPAAGVIFDAMYEMRPEVADRQARSAVAPDPASKI